MEMLSSSDTPQRVSFSSLKKLDDLFMDDVFDTYPLGAEYGRLDNGLHYYVRSNPKPHMRAALALAVKVGSVNEEEAERGVAHIAEHLAFNATKKYTNHEIVKFIESIGAEFGACQNASTSADETIYTLLVPIDKPGLLSQAISILAEFSTEVRVSTEDLEKERGAVLEEWRGGRNASGRIQDAYWQLMLEGSKYAERLPIGLEKVIKTVSPETVKQFYQKWYHLHNMAVVAVGDFIDTQSVVELLKMHFGQKVSPDSSPLVPHYPVPSHAEPRFSCFVDSEAGLSEVMISCKMQVNERKTVKDYRVGLAESMFCCALNQRFFKISRKKDQPFFSCSSSADDFVRSMRAYMLSATCKDKRTVGALESMLMEIARVRLHGFTEREISIVRALLMSNIESAYLERDQIPSNSLQDEYLQHFLCNDPVWGTEFEAQLQKTLLPQISAAEVSKYAENFRTAHSCVVKIVEPQIHATVNDLKAVVLKVNLLEEEQKISSWEEEHIPEELVSTKPDAGKIVQELEFPDIGVTELILSNGMKVCFKCTDFFDDQVLFTGFTYGGSSEIPEDDHFSCLMASDFAEEIGLFGYEPSVLKDMLAGKRADVSVDIGSYVRSFSGVCSPTDLETALQLVYLLFTNNVVPGEEEVHKVLEVTKESIHARERDPYTVYENRVREINYGDSYFFKALKINDLQKVDSRKACAYFNSCFKDPSTFTVLIVGKINPPVALPLIIQYLGGIPKPANPVLHFDRDELKGLPFIFPGTIVREVVRSPMAEAQCLVLLTFPVELKSDNMIEEVHFVWFMCKLLETKLMQLLRFKHGQIYSVGVSTLLGENKPSRTGDARGDISVIFSCDPDTPLKLVDIVLNEIVRLQEEGPLEQDVSTVLEIEQREDEVGLEENGYWIAKIAQSYMSRTYSGDVGASFEIQKKRRKQVRESLTASVAQSALRRLLPLPCTKQYTLVILTPQMLGWKLVSHSLIPQ